MWSLQYMVSLCCGRDDRRVCERDRPAWGCWDDERDARTLAAAEAALLGGTKRRFLPGSPEALSTGWANTLANRLSGWRTQIIQKHMHLIKRSEKWAGIVLRQMPTVSALRIMICEITNLAASAETMQKQKIKCQYFLSSGRFFNILNATGNVFFLFFHFPFAMECFEVCPTQ